MNWIYVTHDSLDGSAKVSEEAFEKIWSQKGWTRVDESLTKDELVALAKERGVDVPAKANKAEVAKALNESQQEA
jgi:hypothetical protein